MFLWSFKLKYLFSPAIQYSSAVLFFTPQMTFSFICFLRAKNDFPKILELILFFVFFKYVTHGFLGSIVFLPEIIFLGLIFITWNRFINIPSLSSSGCLSITFSNDNYKTTLEILKAAFNYKVNVERSKEKDKNLIKDIDQKSAKKE